MAHAQTITMSDRSSVPVTPVTLITMSLGSRPAVLVAAMAGAESPDQAAACASTFLAPLRQALDASA